MKIKVECTFQIEVDVPDDWDEHDRRNVIEDCQCPGTGVVGAALEKHMAAHEEASTCWACALQGQNRIIKK